MDENKTQIPEEEKQKVAESVSTKTELIKEIQNVIRTNGNHEITGNVLQEILLLIVNFLVVDTNNTGVFPITDGHGKLSTSSLSENDGLIVFDEKTCAVKRGDIRANSDAPERGGNIQADYDITSGRYIHAKFDITSDKGKVGSLHSDVFAGNNVIAEKDLQAKGHLELGVKGDASYITIFDKSAPSIQYRIYVDGGNLMCVQN